MASARPPLPCLRISVARQALTLHLPDGAARRWRISTAINGVDCTAGSECTPMGEHRVRLKIGAGCAEGTVFRRRRPTGEVYDASLAQRYPGRDWVLTRILWLEGLEPGINRGTGVDTLRRFIYIHGTADEAQIGQPASHGCIRMRNADVVELFDLTPQGASVYIE